MNKLTAPSTNSETGGETLTATDFSTTKRGLDFMPGPDYRLRHAIEVIKDTYDDDVFIKPKTLAKFGQNEAVGTSFATLMTLPSGVANEAYVSSNAITTISSDNSGDTGTVVIEGHTISGSDLTFVSQTATLMGTSQVTLTTPLARSTRIYNSGTADWAGQIYVYENDTTSGTPGIPDTPAKVHLMSPPGALGRNQSFKASTSISSSDYWLITNLVLGVDKKTSASVDVELQVRTIGGVFRTLFEVPVSTSGNNAIPIALDPVIIVPKNSDVRLRARASTTAVSVSGRMSGYLALIQS